MLVCPSFAPIAIETHMELLQLVWQVSWFANRIAGYIDGNVGASGSKDAQTTLDVGVRLPTLTGYSRSFLGVQIGIEVFVAHRDIDIDIVDCEKRVGIVFQCILDKRKESFLRDRRTGKHKVVILVSDGRARDINALPWGACPPW